MHRFLPGDKLFLQRLSYAIKESAHYSRYNAPMVGWLGVIGFPLYYFIWHDLFPQPYENLWLRLAGTAICLPLIFSRLWPLRLKDHFAAYWLLTMVFTLPFFFTYMLLRNDMSLVWAMSTMAALFLLVLALHDWLLVMLTSVGGSILAWLAFWLTTNETPVLAAYFAQLPIYLFVVVAGSVFNYTAQMVKDEKLDAYASVGRNIAHELRTPLLGMKSAAGAIRQYLPELIHGFRLAQSEGLPVREVRSSRIDQLHSAAMRIDEEIDYSNIIIDMLLLSAGQTSLKADDHGLHSAVSTIEGALARYPFKSSRERELVHFESDVDFIYLGSALLVTHTIFNLLKNSLHSVLKAGKGNIRISVRSDNDKNIVSIRDTGLGIANHDLRHLFEHFYSSKSVEEGSGVGLSFCKRVMESMEGSISCQSVLGEYAEFTLAFPKKD
ncbi:MAG: HAMP domain-containing sensor histidine kinase [Alcanivoracaceae bacterium]|jgi:two-component system CAI-1 autoinducer sensor kinase/phosphatase CqsS|nr:HAMP domain-containing sensor histidine kinase [Alcanivoracaceae bacterium]